MLCAGAWMDPPWCCDAVNEDIDFSHTLFDSIYCLTLDIIGEGVAVDAFGGEAVLCCELVEGDGVIVARCGGPFSACRTFVEDP